MGAEVFLKYVWFWMQGSHTDLETWKNLETWENLEKATFFIQNLENGGSGQLTER